MHVTIPAGSRYAGWQTSIGRTGIGIVTDFDTCLDKTIAATGNLTVVRT